MLGGSAAPSDADEVEVIRVRVDGKGCLGGKRVRCDPMCDEAYLDCLENFCCCNGLEEVKNVIMERLFVVENLMQQDV